MFRIRSLLLTYFTLSELYQVSSARITFGDMVDRQGIQETNLETVAGRTEMPKVGISSDTWDDEITFGLSRSKLAIFIRGYIRGISANKEMCHSCLLVYDYIFYTVVAIEDLYEEWMFQDGMGVDGSYRIFK